MLQASLKSSSKAKLDRKKTEIGIERNRDKTQTTIVQM